MNVVYFTHSLASCWNHGNAHFVRGVLREFALRGDNVMAMEPDGAWSLTNLLADHGPAGLQAYQAAYPELRTQTYGSAADYEEAVADADIVIVHEWNDPALVAAIGSMRRNGSPFVLLFHDTHHRAASDPEAIRAFDLDGYDGVLAFGEALAAIYRRWGWGRRVWVWHEAADTRLFHPPEIEQARDGLVWIGNWGDGERSAELEQFLFRPAQTLRLSLDVYGVRYPDGALDTLRRSGARYRGWLPNARAPEVFAQHVATVHVPRRYYVDLLPGIPTIRIFEALACGIPLVSAPWDDSENLFRPGEDFLMARDEAEMTRHLATLCNDECMREAVAESGLARIVAHHTCRHRMQELIAIVSTISPGMMKETVA